MKKFGFTLAEVLIALTIIGVIAAITVPALVQNTEKREIVTALKKAQSTLSQATSRIIMENGPVNTWNDMSGKELAALYGRYLNNVKECDNGSNCPASVKYKTLTGGELVRYAQLALADGMLIQFENFSNSCSGDRNDTGSKGICASIFVDINGEKKPSRVAYDLFVFTLKEGGIQPAGCDYDHCNRYYWGLACACKVLKEGRIDY